MQIDVNVSLKIDESKIVSALRDETTKRMAAIGHVVEGKARRSIRRGFPPASRPGQPPHSRRYQQGLLGSVFSDLVELDHGEVAVVVGTTMRHGLFLELGTSRMAARPWLRPALYSSVPEIQRIWSKPLPGGA